MSSILPSRATLANYGKAIAEVDAVRYGVNVVGKWSFLTRCAVTLMPVLQDMSPQNKALTVGATALCTSAHPLVRAIVNKAANLLHLDKKCGPLPLEATSGLITATITATALYTLTRYSDDLFDRINPLTATYVTLAGILSPIAYPLVLNLWTHAINYINSCELRKADPTKHEETTAKESNVLPLNKDNFDATIAQGVTLVDFYTDWCGPCKALAPQVELLAKELKGQVQVGKVNYDKSAEIGTKWNVMGFPTVIIFKDGKEVKRIEGLTPNFVDQVKQTVESLKTPQAQA